MTNLLPTVTATITLTLSASVSADIITHWIGLRTGSPGSLLNTMSATDTIFTITGASRSSTNLAFGLVSIVPGSCIVIDDEVMYVTAIDGAGQVTVERNVVPFALPAASHLPGATIFVLKYPDAWAVMASEALLPWAQQVVASRGANSATFGYQISGSLALE